MVADQHDQVSRCWHPEPQDKIVQLRNGSNASVEVGAPAYQLSNGNVIKLA